jgi:hypothetical protein
MGTNAIPEFKIAAVAVLLAAMALLLVVARKRRLRSSNTFNNLMAPAL